MKGELREAEKIGTRHVASPLRSDGALAVGFRRNATGASRPRRAAGQRHLRNNGGRYGRDGARPSRSELTLLYLSVWHTGGG